MTGWNRAVGWTSLAAGVGVGLTLGLWSFDGPMAVPEWLGDYGDTPRRLTRLGHIAFIGLGILDILIADALGRSGLAASSQRAAGGLMIAGNIFLPLTLLAAAVWRPIKYAMPLPALCVFVALVLTARGLCRPAAISNERLT